MKQICFKNIYKLITEIPGLLIKLKIYIIWEKESEKKRLMFYFILLYIF